MAVLLKNNASSTLLASISDSATTVTIQSADAALYPDPGASDWFPLTVVDSAGNMEIMRVTARAGNDLTVTRAQEDTTAIAFDAGARAELRLTIGALAEFALSSEVLKPSDIGASVQAYDAKTAKTDQPQTFTKPQRISFTTATYGSTITLDLANNNGHIVPLSGNPIMANPTNMAAAVGQEVVIDFTGEYQPSFGSYWIFPGGEAPTFEGGRNRVAGVVRSATEIWANHSSYGAV